MIKLKLLTTAVITAICSLSIYGAGLTPFKDEKNGLLGLKDETGKVCLKAEYDSVNAEPMSGGYLILKKDKGYGLVNSLGKTVLKAQYDTIIPEPSYQCFFTRNNKKYYGVIYKDGSELVASNFTGLTKLMENDTQYPTYIFSGGKVEGKGATPYLYMYVNDKGYIDYEKFNNLTFEDSEMPYTKIIGTPIIGSPYRNDELKQLYLYVRSGLSNTFNVYNLMARGKVIAVFFNKQSGNGYFVVDNGYKYVYPYENWKYSKEIHELISKLRQVTGNQQGNGPIELCYGRGYSKYDNMVEFEVELTGGADNGCRLRYLTDSDEWCITYSKAVENYRVWFDSKYVCDPSGKKFGIFDMRNHVVAWSDDPSDRVVDGVFIKYKDGALCTIDPETGETKISIKCDKETSSLECLRNSGAKGFIFTSNGKKGFYGEDGKRLIAAEYDSICPQKINNNNLLVYDKGKVGIFEADPKEPRWIVPARKYDSVEYLEGLAYWVELNGKYGVVYNGKEVIPPVHKKENIKKGGHIATSKGNDPDRNTFYVWNDAGQIGVYNFNGKLIVPFGRYDKIVGCCYDIVVGKKGDKIGGTSYNGVAIIAPVYDAYLGCGSNGNFFFYNKVNGVECIYAISPSGSKLATIKQPTRLQLERFFVKWTSGHFFNPAYE